MKYLLIVSCTGTEFCWVLSHCGLYWNEISDKLAKQDAMKSVSVILSNNLILSSYETACIFEIKCTIQLSIYQCIKNLEKSKSAIPSCLIYLARAIYKFRLNSWNTKYSQTVACICKNVLAVNHILLYCPITTKSFQKNGYDFNACNSVRNILCNTDVMTSVFKLIVHSAVGKLL